MKLPRLLITGASGWIGRSLYSHLQEFDPIGVYFNSTLTPPTRGWLGADLRNKAEVAALLQQIRPDVIFHFAALPSPRINREQPKLAEATNVGVTKNLVAHLSEGTHSSFYRAIRYTTAETLRLQK